MPCRPAPTVLSINVATSTVECSYARKPTGIGKSPIEGSIAVREPGRKRDGLGSGLVGDVIGNHRHHGGTDQAVYAFAREVLDEWEGRLDRSLPNGFFGENLTTAGLDVDGGLLGERWRIGSDVILQLTGPRIPCNTFRGWVGARGWLKTFTVDGRSGAYFRVIEPGTISAGDRIEVVHRPTHGVTVAQAFRALMTDRSLLPTLAAAGDDLIPELRETVAAG